ncbi:phospholipid-translocating P-type ATPase [Diplocarpon rosae]|nr:phospholipid-translocating P-type ATPase [Diplocarpon rosae]
MAGQTPSHRDDLLLDLHDEQPTYNNGQRPPLNDDDMLRAYNADHEEASSRPSISYDEFVGAGEGVHSSRQRPGGSGTASRGPYASDQTNRIYSQTSGLENYQRYADDLDDFPDDGQSLMGDDLDDFPDDGQSLYYQQGGAIPGDGAGMKLGGNPRNRNSVLSMGGELVGKAKSMLGMAPGANKYVDNHISTAKYNVATFLPKFLYEQFSKFANIFFLFTAALQQIPDISPTNKYTTIGPLILVLLVSAGKELIEDRKRKISDNQLNNSKAKVLRGSQFEETRWINVAVGDMIRVESEEPFPADIVLLASSEPEGLCYIETANLDGETNLKIKQAIPETSVMVSMNDLSRLGGKLRSEQPNSSLYTYEATLTLAAGGGEKELPLQPDQLLLRGATLRNTPWIHGVVVFTGHESKLMRNATSTPIKRTAVERQLNMLVLLLVGILVALSLISSAGDLIVRAYKGKELSYLGYAASTSAMSKFKQFSSDILTYWVLYSALVPISLFVTLEIVKYWHAILINDDLDMYYDKSDTPAVCRTSSLVEELGMVEYIFSDKTGTLTCNQMEFKECSIGGVQYATEVSDDRRPTMIGGVEVGVHDFARLKENLESHESALAIHHFLCLLSTCHTVIPERNDEKGGEIKYQAASPDEGALVEGAVLMGYQFTARKPRSVQITVKGEEFEYELLAVCEFNSTRKRMSAIFRCPDGQIRCYCKGADTVILERLGPDNPHTELTLQHLEEYASEGLRTLCLAMREISDREFEEWWKVFEKAQTTVGGNRADELDKAAELLEKDFYLLGATAIEDRLQDGVPETIHTLQEAGIKYSFQNAFSGEVIFESWTLSFYNVFFTFFPPLAMGIFDQFISARLLDRYPQLYQLGQKNTFFKMHSFFSWVGNGFYHSLVLYIAAQLIWWLDLPQGDGKTAGHWVWGTAMYTSVLATVLGKAGLVTNIWTKYHVIAIPGSMVIWMVFVAVYATEEEEEEEEEDEDEEDEEVTGGAEKRALPARAHRKRGVDLAGFNAALTYSLNAVKTGPEVQLGTGSQGAGVGVTQKAGGMASTPGAAH